MAVIVVVVIVAAALGVGYSLGWFKSSSSKCGTATKGTLLGEGSTLVQPLMSYWATTYWGGGVLTYDGVGSTSGITSVQNRVSDFGATDAPLTPSQVTGLPSGSTALLFPESAGGVVPIFYLPGSGITSLDFNGSVLAQMFDGQLTNWNNTALQALNPHVVLPSATIIPVYRSGGSGTTFIFSSFLTAENSYWSTNYGKGTYWPSALQVPPEIVATGSGGEATLVAETADAIGYVDLNYALSNGGVTIGAVENPAGKFVKATTSNTESALVDSNVTLPAGSDFKDWFNVSLLNAPGPADYPITSLTYVLVYQNLNVYSGSTHGSYTMNQAENLVDFLTWIVTQGQNYSYQLYYAPLPASFQAHDLATIASITLGGTSIPVCVPS